MNFFQRLRDALGVNEEYEDYYYYDDSELADAAVPPEGAIDRRPAANALPSHAPNNVIGLPGLPGQTEVVVMEPRSFDEMPRVVTALRERKSVILNLTYINDDQAQRSADYVAGATFAIDGHQTRLGERIFLFTPNYVHISSYPDLPAIEPPAPVPHLPTSQSSPMPPQLSEPVQPRQMQYHQTTTNPGI